MHTLRVRDAIIARPADALPRLAWLELLNACHALPCGPPKYSLVNREADRWRTAVQTKPMLRSYLCVRSYDLRYQEHLEHPDWQVNLARWRLRTGICCLAEAKGRWSGIAAGDRTCDSVRVPWMRQGARARVCAALPPCVFTLVG